MLWLLIDEPVLTKNMHLKDYINVACSKYYRHYSNIFSIIFFVTSFTSRTSFIMFSFSVIVVTIFQVLFAGLKDWVIIDLAKRICYFYMRLHRIKCKALYRSYTSIILCSIIYLLTTCTTCKQTAQQIT